MKTKPLLLTVGLLAALFSQRAQSQTLYTTFVEINPNVPVSGSFDGSNFYDIPSGISIFTDFQSFCVEPLDHLSYGQAVIYDIQDPATLANSASIARLVGGYLASSQTALDAAAVQWAIWEVVAEISPVKSLADGNIVIAPTNVSNPNGTDVSSLADIYLANINSFTPATLTYMTSPDAQDQVAWVPVPEPAGLCLAALSGLLFFRRRR